MGPNCRTTLLKKTIIPSERPDSAVLKESTSPTANSFGRDELSRYSHILANVHPKSSAFQRSHPWLAGLAVDQFSKERIVSLRTVSSFSISSRRSSTTIFGPSLRALSG